MEFEVIRSDHKSMAVETKQDKRMTKLREKQPPEHRCIGTMELWERLCIGHRHAMEHRSAGDNPRFHTIREPSTLLSA